MCGERCAGGCVRFGSDMRVCSSPCRRCAVLTPVRWCAAEHDMDGAPVLHPSGQKHVVVLGMLWQWHGDPWLVAG